VSSWVNGKSLGNWG